MLQLLSTLRLMSFISSFFAFGFVIEALI